MKNNSTPFAQDRLISKQQAADFLCVSVRTIERMVSGRELTIQKVMGCVRLRLSEVMKFAGIENQATPSPS